MDRIDIEGLGLVVCEGCGHVGTGQEFGVVVGRTVGKCPECGFVECARLTLPDLHTISPAAMQALLGKAVQS